MVESVSKAVRVNEMVLGFRRVRDVDNVVSDGKVFNFKNNFNVKDVRVVATNVGWAVENVPLAVVHELKFSTLFDDAGNDNLYLMNLRGVLVVGNCREGSHFFLLYFCCAIRLERLGFLLVVYLFLVFRKILWT